jgi:hypothetical protein
LRSVWPAYALAEPDKAYTLGMLLSRLTVGVVCTLAAGAVATIAARGHQADARPAGHEHAPAAAREAPGVDVLRTSAGALVDDRTMRVEAVAPLVRLQRFAEDRIVAEALDRELGNPMAEVAAAIALEELLGEQTAGRLPVLRPEDVAGFELRVRRRRRGENQNDGQPMRGSDGHAKRQPANFGRERRVEAASRRFAHENGFRRSGA